MTAARRTNLCNCGGSMVHSPGARGCVYARPRVLCANGEPHYSLQQDVLTFRSLEIACQWADEFAPCRTMCGPHRIGVPDARAT